MFYVYTHTYKTNCIQWDVLTRTLNQLQRIHWIIHSKREHEVEEFVANRRRENESNIVASFIIVQLRLIENQIKLCAMEMMFEIGFNSCQFRSFASVKFTIYLCLLLLFFCLACIALELLASGQCMNK